MAQPQGIRKEIRIQKKLIAKPGVIVLKIGITGRKGNALAVGAAKAAMALLSRKGALVEVDAAFIRTKGTKPLKKFSCGMVLSFGGDGTLLATFHGLAKKIPVMGINCGNRGFLQSYGHTEAGQATRDVIDGRFSVQERTRIRAKVDGKTVGEALNEVVVVPKKAGRILRYMLRIGKDSHEEAGDGLIVATPTGSTAHALSAGGPVVRGNAPVFVVVSMNPVDGAHRPLVLNDHEKVVVSGFERMGAQAILDGRKWIPVRKKIELTKGGKALLAIRK